MAARKVSYSSLASTHSIKLNTCFERSVIAQGCHASVAVMQKFRDDERVKTYVSDVESMHKVVLETKNEASLLKMAENLKQNNIPYYLWTEQPENMPTCLATVPIVRSDLGDSLKKCSLMR
ncbi:peptidyl-tRNA hydrolase domain-containing protein 1 [Coemansia sp. RSA 1822]|nr:peptidyl-tRNA hydrolase domain-containing protein 1 [Coemansia sp. RSA 1822]